MWESRKWTCWVGLILASYLHCSVSVLKVQVGLFGGYTVDVRSKDGVEILEKAL